LSLLRRGVWGKEGKNQDDKVNGSAHLFAFHRQKLSNG
jgi:hypothetical protein